MGKRVENSRHWPWFIIPLLLLGAIAAGLYFFGGSGGAFSSDRGYDLR